MKCSANEKTLISEFPWDATDIQQLWGQRTQVRGNDETMADEIQQSTPGTYTSVDRLKR